MEAKVIATATRLLEGRPLPLGATCEEQGINFSLYSQNATKVELCIFDDKGEREIERFEMPEHTDGIWHGFLSGAAAGAVYGYRVYGPYEPEAGHRFNPNKLLMDPYSRLQVGELTWDPAVYGYTLGSPDGDLSFDTRDSAAFVPKCVVVGRSPQLTPDSPLRPRIRWEDTIIYETHVGGFTKRHTGIPQEIRGKYAGLGNKEIIAYIKSLGVTAVELLPIHSFLDDAHLLENGRKNYWGYTAINFFTPAARYATEATGVINEFRQMVTDIHEAGLEVILDVVYNHTAEGNELGATLCYKGIDNSVYYRLQAENPRYYINDTGTGNTINMSHSSTVRLVTDSLRYWAGEMGVDGFRFDLGTILAREPEGFDTRHGFLYAVTQDPLLSGVKMIAEPWDVGPGGYQVGAFPPGWAEWNDTFRDITRDFWRGEAAPSSLAEKLLASPLQFHHNGRRTWASVNFVTAHDGFTLHDLVSYNEKHNDENGENNNDGSSDNHSWNCGAEGPTDNQDILDLRDRQMRNLLTTLLLSQGTPMLLAGDEVAHTQNGNNNVYCQDSQISWMNWEHDDRAKALRQFVQKLTSLRARGAIFQSSSFFTAATDDDESKRNVMWFDAAGTTIEEAQWQDPHMQSFAMLLEVERHDGKGTSTMFFAFNSYYDVVEFTLPAYPDQTSWEMVIDTNQPTESSQPKFKAGQKYGVTGRSLVVFEKRG